MQTLRMNAHDAFTETLNVMRGERDEMDEARWHYYDLEQEREALTEKALDECLKAGVSMESLKTLTRETGATRWAIKKSLKS